MVPSPVICVALVLYAGSDGCVDEESRELLVQVLDMFADQYTSLLGSLEKKHNIQLDHLLGGTFCGSQRLKRDVSRGRGRVCVYIS